MLSIGLLLGASAVSRLTISSHRRCALRRVSLAGMLVPYVGAFARSALVRAHPTRRRARIIMGGAACRGRYGPGRQSPVSPYKLGNRLRLATFPPVRNVSPCRVCHAARTCSVRARGSQHPWLPSADWWPLGVIKLPGHTPRAYSTTHCSPSTLHRASAYGK